MLAALVIVFREVLEAGLIIGVVLAASRGIHGRNGAVAFGVVAGILSASIVAVFATRISDAFDGRGQEFFVAAILLFAVVMLAWHVVWMAEHAREMTQELRQLSSDVAAGKQSLFALGAAVAIAVMREGSEVVLFMMGIVMQGRDTSGELLLGSGIGLLLGAGVSLVLYLGLAAIPLKRMFSVTGALVTLLAAGLAASAVQQLSNAGLLNVLDTKLWDTSWLLSQDSWVGRVLHVLIGYMDRPTGMQLIAYAITACTIFLLAYWRGTPRVARSSVGV
ncbi:iron permease FTR1 [Hyphomicrobium denitrificans 1NES1]|uniref:Iron permease FTR1 n=1 Tax=Hyphomicrobium denitrificans 1NES1 TaxID=670307 RepID=N0BIT1_9HYPH|nr:FTR1 family protein [Hyphomicrobium denitrificans]AGK60025.1 iron permease FTR1 [Hyphomicrobium denitrificans 1NES1]